MSGEFTATITAMPKAKTHLPTRATKFTVAAGADQGTVLLNTILWILMMLVIGLIIWSLRKRGAAGVTPMAGASQGWSLHAYVDKKRQRDNRE